MDNRKKLLQWEVVTEILLKKLSDDDIRYAEYKLKTYKEDMEYGSVYKMELIDKIYCKLLEEKLFTIEELFELLYDLKFEYTLCVYYKMDLINQFLNGGFYKNKIKRKYKGFIYGTKNNKK
jgi:hypothetical protein